MEREVNNEDLILPPTPINFMVTRCQIFKKKSKDGVECQQTQTSHRASHRYTHMRLFKCAVELHIAIFSGKKKNNTKPDIKTWWATCTGHGEFQTRDDKVTMLSTYNCRKINLYLNLQEEKFFWCNFHPTVVIQQVAYKRILLSSLY